MPMISFNSRHPNDGSADVDHGEIGRRYEQLIANPAYTNSSHRDHYRVVDEAAALAEAMWGSNNLDGGQPFGVFSVNTKTGEPSQHGVSTGMHGIQYGELTNIADGRGTADEHEVADHRPLK